jgi:excisionase family DNA binding protein
MCGIGSRRDTHSEDELNMTSSVSPRADQGRSTLSGAALLTVDDVAALLNVSTRTVRRMADSGAMPRPVKLASLIRWRRDDIDAWVAAGCPSCRQTRGAK